MESIIRVGENSMSFRRFDRLALLIDGDEYYRAFFNVAPRAKKSIYILGWEIDVRVGLKKVQEFLPDDLRDYFIRLANRNPRLKINIMSWKSSFYLLFQREKFARTKWKFEAPSTVSYQEKTHPYLYGTHHEKMVIVNESCAFMGGMDISRKRWDTREHRVVHPLRIDQAGAHYHPIHDVQAVCSGPLVEDLLRYLQRRHLDVTVAPEEKREIWPDRTPLTLYNSEAALSCTNVKERKFEIEKLYLDAIGAAKKFIYIENQYFSHTGIIDKLSERLTDPLGPEIVIVLPHSYRGHFERAIYEAARNKALKKLKASDRHGRLMLLYPAITSEENKPFIIVHSKFMIVDNEFMTIGSANLNYRSMRVDSELNLSFEAKGSDDVERFIRQNFTKLITEHLNVASGEWENVLAQQSLVASIAHFQGKSQRTLREFTVTRKRFEDYFLLLLAPFVDIRFSLPKLNLMVILFAMLFMGFIFNEVSQ